jgi:hypothetical protein
VLGYLKGKYCDVIRKMVEKEEKRFGKMKGEDKERKEKHLKLFRPNLENPANKTMTLELNEEERKRTEAFKELIDEV